MNILKVQNDYSWLYTNDQELINKLYNALRFPTKGYFHSTLYKKGQWDGFTEFYKPKTGRFLTGLLPEITTALKIMDRPYKIEDHRGQIDFGDDKIDADYLKQWNPDFELRDYQVEFINHVSKYQRGVIYAPTSAGKTEIMIGIMKRLPEGVPVLFLANRKSLIDQNYKKMVEWGFENVGKVYDKFVEPNLITCSTVQSLHKIEKALPHFKVLIVDEIHTMMTASTKKYYNKMKGACVRAAFSATPFKFGGTDKVQKYSVKGYFGPVLKTANTDEGILTTKSLQDRDILSKSKCTFYHIKEPSIPYAIYQDAVTLGLAESVYFHEVVTNLTKTLKGRTLILVERIAHGDSLNYMIPGSLWVQGRDDLDARNHVIKELQERKDDCVAIATQGIFNAGINVFVHNLINAAGGKAEHQIIQRMGRGLRTADDKEGLNYYDFVFDINDYLLSHSKKRVRILRKEGHEVHIKRKHDFS